ncbi:putative dithiol-disulfide oxidoreductase (DUF899 family) [Nocardia sp. GAS34]|uniref:hypothetical protein n=1 Tax=unclassified Nocardia TaxID=2637762 RepID=UPI003D263377
MRRGATDRWATLRHSDITFPGESGEYWRARNELLDAEDELRRLNEKVAAYMASGT